MRRRYTFAAMTVILSAPLFPFSFSHPSFIASTTMEFTHEQ
ncbi:hypothetical protein D8I24_2248 (plasmid) [Cupriavidus necator H850]|nr:hypothetical protein D8I24_2248 [Cupriavidus necator H850]